MHSSCAGLTSFFSPSSRKVTISASHGNRTCTDCSSPEVVNTTLNTSEDVAPPQPQGQPPSNTQMILWQPQSIALALLPTPQQQCDAIPQHGDTSDLDEDSTRPASKRGRARPPQKQAGSFSPQPLQDCASIALANMSAFHCLVPLSHRNRPSSQQQRVIHRHELVSKLPDSQLPVCWLNGTEQEVSDHKHKVKHQPLGKFWVNWSATRDTV